jgi:protein PhnA
VSENTPCPKCQSPYAFAMDALMVCPECAHEWNPKAIKAGTKVKNIKLVDGDHNIDCKIDGFGSMALKSEFVKKA